MPQHEEEEEIKVDVPGESQKVLKVKKMYDDDQKEKALAIVVRNVPNATFKNYFVINEFAGKAIREGFVEFINDYELSIVLRDLVFEDLEEGDYFDILRVFTTSYKNILNVLFDLKTKG